MKNKNTIVSIAIIAIIFVGLIWIAKPNQNQNEKTNAVTETNSLDANAHDDSHHEAGEAGGALTLEVSEPFYNFGEVSMKNGNVFREFKVKNNTSSSINIAKIFTSCMCTTASIAVGDKTKGPFGMPGHGIVPKANMEILAGEEAIVTVEFDPNAHGPAGVGRIEREIYLENDAGAQTVLKFEATVTP